MRLCNIFKNLFKFSIVGSGTKYKPLTYKKKKNDVQSQNSSREDKDKLKSMQDSISINKRVGQTDCDLG